MRPQAAVAGKVFIQRERLHPMAPCASSRPSFYFFSSELENRDDIGGDWISTDSNDYPNEVVVAPNNENRERATGRPKSSLRRPIRKLNSLYAEAEKLGGQSYPEGCWPALLLPFPMY
ncbi:unnamed protein product [Ranitomeya imitator]|uniref:Uncharacterized protein n=1 Tax=Ranitomeya imitator TaxID=111125 RepID=A0ABN9KYE5_9NEOB|nr:unnamed protein product [Ranitomeya imitator]